MALGVMQPVLASTHRGFDSLIPAAGYFGAMPATGLACKIMVEHPWS
jgi:hypothetical protein